MEVALPTPRPEPAAPSPAVLAFRSVLMLAAAGSWLFVLPLELLRLAAG